MNEIKETMQHRKKEFNKDIEILKKLQIEILEMKNLTLQISIKCPANIMDYVENKSIRH
jgi:hypothetical protein